MKNKHGDIPITILVIGTFVVCALALLSFYASNVVVGKSFVGIDLMEKMDSKINEYNFYNFKGFSEERIKEILKQENFYFEEDGFLINKTNEAFWPWQDNEFLFSVKFYIK